jgi:F0F1-type ATP synthase epsilon subunit
MQGQYKVLCCGALDTLYSCCTLPPTRRFSEQQQQRMAAVSAGLDALKQHQAELHMSAAELGAAARMEAAEQQLAGLQQVLQQADAEHAAKVEQILQQLAKVRR